MQQPMTSKIQTRAPRARATARHMLQMTAVIAAVGACKTEPKLPPATYDQSPFVAAAGQDPTAVKARSTLKQLVTLDGAESGKSYRWDSAAISPNGRFFASAYKNVSKPKEGRLGLWQLSDGARAWVSTEWVWSEGCDFHPSGDRIYCAHQPRPDWSKTELLVFNAADGKLLDRVAVPTKVQKDMPELWWGDSARVSPDGKWAGMTQLINGKEGSQVAIIAIGSDGKHTVSGVFANAFPDEVAFTPDGQTMYCSDYEKKALQRYRLAGGKWSHDGDLPVQVRAAGIDIDGKGQVIVNGFRKKQVAIVSPAADWMASQVRVIAVDGVSYELCADARPGAGYAWSVSQNGAAQSIDTTAGKVLKVSNVIPIDVDGVSMSCHRKTGAPYLVSAGRVWTWTE